jgi:prepilin-type N-terminal cleavage/methylation domain-containing protein
MKIIKKKQQGFSLVEVLVGVALVSIALLGLAQMFIVSIAQNTRSDRMTNATFLTQQQIEQLRTLTANELNALLGTPIDEILDLNVDGINDYRRITLVQTVGDYYEVRVAVFSGNVAGVSAEDMLADPENYKVKTDNTTVITR